MSDDVFDLGEPADELDESSATTDDSSNTGNSATSANNDSTSNNASSSSDGGNDTEDPTRTPAYDTDYQSTQRTIGVRQETWDDVIDLLEDAQAYSKLDGYRDVTKLESYEALFQHLLDTCDAKEIASKIQTARHEAHDAS